MEPHTIPPLMLKEAAHSLTQAKFRRRAGTEGEARAHNTKLEQHDPFQKAGPDGSFFGRPLLSILRGASE